MHIEKFILILALLAMVFHFMGGLAVAWAVPVALIAAVILGGMFLILVYVR